MISTYHFESKPAALSHYISHGLTKAEAEKLLDDGCVVIGKPELREGETLHLHKKTRRYYIKEAR